MQFLNLRTLKGKQNQLRI
uniref:ADP-ribosylation factor-related protein 1 isoform X1 n=1 Tax=Rhizophora mucronata TaxID=61149 RepID=A0A2P2L2C5_RHIMU